MSDEQNSNVPGGQGQANTDAGQPGSGTPGGTQEGGNGQGTQSTPSATPAARAPEKYELKAPEGVEFHPKAMENFTSLAKELDLPNEHAQKLADFLVGMNGERVKEWTEQVKADKEIGGAQMEESILPVAEKALDAFGTAELKQLLKGTGFSNHPEFVRLFYRIGKALKEDDVHTGGADPAATDAAQLLYGKSGKQ